MSGGEAGESPPAVNGSPRDRGFRVQIGDVAAGRDVNFGLDEEGVRLVFRQELSAIAKAKAVPEKPLRAVLRKLGEKHVPSAEILGRLASAADELIQLRAGLASLRARECAAVRAHASNLIDQGEFDEARAALREGHELARTLEELKTAILRFAERNPHVIAVFHEGHRIIEEGAEITEFFLIQQGVVSISVRERAIALRLDGDLIGKTAILQRQERSTATVQVVSAKATVIRMSRPDILALLRSDAKITELIIAIWEMVATRRGETQQVLAGGVRVEHRVMSVLHADIHNLSMLGKTVWDELSETFLFEFIEAANITSDSFDGIFKDQGNGFTNRSGT